MSLGKLPAAADVRELAEGRFSINFYHWPPGGSADSGGFRAMIVTTKDLFEQAYGKYAVGAYNINNLEQTIGLFRGNLGKKNSNEEPTNPATSAPFIIQISRGARSYTDKRFLESMIRDGRGDLSRGNLRRPSRSRHRRGGLRVHRQRLLLVGHDRRFARTV